VSHETSSGGFLGLGWRLPLYRRYWYYIKTCTNYFQLIQSERTGRPFSEIKIRGGINLNFPDYIQARGFFQEIWYHRLYTRYYSHHQRPGTVVDIGANIGFFTLYAKWLWPECTVYSFEPAPENYHYLQHNIQNSGKSDITAYNLAVTDGRQETINFFLKEHSGSHSIFSDISSHEVTVKSSIAIPTISLEKILELTKQRIDFMKIDCEGCEWEILTNSSNLLGQVRYIAMEYHLPPGKKVDEMASILRNAGFRLKIEPPFDWGDWKLGFLYGEKPSG
jgi:FkbM family methyltransferase